MAEVRIEQDGRVWDAVIDYSRALTVGELSKAVTGGDDRFELSVMGPDGSAASPRDRFTSSGCRRGQVLSIVPSGAARYERPAAARTVAELVVGTGEASRRFPLVGGDNYVGRDPSCEVVVDDGAVSKRHCRITVGESIEVTDLGSTNGVAVNGRLIRGTHVLNAGDRVVLGGFEATVVRTHHRPIITGHDVPFNRAPRVFRPFSGPPLRFPAPPTRPNRFEFPWLTVSATLAMAVAFYFISNSVQTVIFLAFTPFLLVFGLLESTRSAQRQFKVQATRWREQCASLVQQLREASNEDRRLSNINHPRSDQVLALPAVQGTQLWERRSSDPDFLHLRIGAGSRPVALEIDVPSDGDPELLGEVTAAVERERMVTPAPVAVELPNVGSVGIAGAREQATAIARSMLLSICSLHSPSEVGLGAILSEGTSEEWNWLKWLPHARTGRSALGDPALGGGESAVKILTHLERLVNERLDRSVQSEAETDEVEAQAVRLVVLVDLIDGADLVAFNDLFAKAVTAGVYFIWLGPDYASLPTRCGSVVLTTGSGEAATAELGLAQSGQRVEDIRPDLVSHDDAARAALALAALVDAGIRGDDNTNLPTSVSLVEILEDGGPIDSVETVRRRWAESAARVVGADEPPSGLLMSIGRGADGAALQLDLRADGPHALVAGTTGAGKSEFLQTLVSSLALNYSPTRVNFLLVDYKGGSAFKDCKHLPHTIGMVTDLDTHEVRRVLVSLEAELKRREELLNEAGAKDLLDMERRSAATAPPSLLIVVDEFAALVSEVPEFVEGVVNIAQRGRSLGLHLVLATQRPAGVITDTIRANTNLRVALRVAEAVESVDVIGSPIAAEIPRSTPGRATVRIGAAELLRFQSAYVGGYTDLNVSSVRIGRFNLDGYVFPPDPNPSQRRLHDEIDTDLKRIVEVTKAAVAAEGIPDPYRPWLDPLPPVHALEDIQRTTSSSAICIGTIDRPEQQRQLPAVLDLDQVGSVLIYGASRSGKTVLLRTVASSLARRNSTEAVHVYAIDCAGRALEPLGRLPAVGSVLLVEDHERVNRLLRNLRATIDRRSELFSRQGVANLAEYQSRHPESAREARIVVLLDGLATFSAVYEQIERGAALDLLSRLVADGRSAGVHFVMTADQRNFGIPQISNTVQHRIILRMANPDDYMDFGLPADAISPTAPPGRGYFRPDEELQVAVLGGTAHGGEQVEAIELLAARQSHLPRTPPVPLFPIQIDGDLLPRQSGTRATVGLREIDLQPAIVDFEHDHFVIFGPAQSGKTNALRLIASQMLEPERKLRSLLFVPRSGSALLGLDWSDVGIGPEALTERLQALLEAAETHDLDPTLVVIDDLVDFVDSSGDSLLADLVKLSVSQPMRFLVSSDATRMKGSYLDSIRALQHERCGLLLQPDSERHEDLLEVTLPRGIPIDLPPGRGYQVDRSGRALMVQVGWSGASDPGSATR